jgi:hypothetical protein
VYIENSSKEQVWEDFRYMVREVFLRGEKNKTKNISRWCTYCNYKSICHTEFSGGDREDVIKKDFIRKR